MSEKMAYEVLEHLERARRAYTDYALLFGSDTSILSDLERADIERGFYDARRKFEKAVNEARRIGVIRE